MGRRWWWLGLPILVVVAGLAWWYAVPALFQAAAPSVVDGLNDAADTATGVSEDLHRRAEEARPVKRRRAP